MSNSADGPRTGVDPESTPFGGRDVLPIEKQRRAHQFLTQETRYHVIQATLGHPDHLVTLDELEYLVPKNRSTIREHLDRLAERSIVRKYSYEGEDAKQNDPREFWEFTSYGCSLLDEYDYLRYVPLLRALQETLYLTEKIQRHRDAERPALPDDVADTFTAPELDTDTERAIDEALAAREQGGRLFDAPPVEPDPDATTNGDADRPIDELF